MEWLNILPRLLQFMLLLGFVIEWISLAHNHHRLVRVGETLFSVAALILTLLFLNHPTGEAQLMALAFIVMIIGNSLIVRRQMRKFVFRILVTGVKDDLVSFLSKYDLSIKSQERELQDGSTVLFAHLIRGSKPEFEILPEVVLNLSAAPDRRIWQLCLVTAFGIREETILSIVREMGVFRDCESIYYHMQFQSGVHLIHLLDFQPSNWNLSG